MKKEYTFTPLNEYKKVKDDKDKTTYEFIPKSSNLPLRSVYKEINKPVLVRNIDWSYFD